MCGVGGCRFGAWLVVLLGLAGSIPAATHDPDDQDCAAFAGDGWVSASGRHVHDPTLFEASAGSYLCFSTSGDGFGVVRSSQNLIDWTVHGAITETPQWLRQRIPEHRSMWAPDLLRLPDGRLRLYYCASQRFGQNTSWIGLAENDAFDPSRPQQGWRDLGPVIHSQRDRDDFNAIDPDAVIDAASGQHWLFFGSFWSGLYALELDPDTGKPLNPDKPQMIPVARNSERGNPIEAPVVAFRDGYYYLFVSYGLAAQGVRSTYRIVVGRSRQITGPYLGRDGRPMLEGGHAVVLKSSAPMFAPGHCDVMRDSSGRWLLAYHFYDARRFWVDDKWGLPTLQIRELIWDDAGWPLPGLPVQYPARADAPGSAEADVVGRWMHQADFTQPVMIELRDDGSAVQAGGLIGTWSRDGGKLTLRWPRGARDGADQPFWIDTVQLAYGGKYYVGTNQAGVVVRGMRQQ